MAIDTFLVQNTGLTKLVLKNVSLTQDNLKLLAGTIETSQGLREVDLSWNNLKNGGAREVSKIICRNKYMQFLDISNNSVSEDGLVSILDALQGNTSLRRLVCEG